MIQWWGAILLPPRYHVGNELTNPFATDIYTIHCENRPEISIHTYSYRKAKTNNNVGEVMSFSKKQYAKIGEIAIICEIHFTTQFIRRLVLHNQRRCSRETKVTYRLKKSRILSLQYLTFRTATRGKNKIGKVISQICRAISKISEAYHKRVWSLLLVRNEYECELPGRIRVPFPENVLYILSVSPLWTQ